MKKIEKRTLIELHIGVSLRNMSDIEELKKKVAYTVFSYEASLRL